MICSQSITVLRAPTTTDRRNDEIRDWANPERIIVSGVSVQPGVQLEPQGFQRGREGDLRDATVTGWKVFSQRGTDIDVFASDRVELDDGTVCEVIGEVGRWPSPGGGVHHVEFLLQRVEG